MSAPPVSVWATKPGAWALDAEEHEEELQQQRECMLQTKAAAVVPEEEFPSLKAAVATKGKKKKNKGQTLSLAEFTTYSAAKGSRDVDLVNLPTGPRERNADEEMGRSRLGGGFRSYGDGDRWGRDRGTADEVRRPRGESREPLGPSRADEVDDWGAGKRSFVSGGGVDERRGRSGAGGGFFGSESKADEVDNWVSAKKSFAPSESGRRHGSRGYDLGSNGGGADSDTWGRKREEQFVNGSENGSSGRPKLNLKPRSVPLSNDGRPQSPDLLLVKPQSADVVVMKKSFNPFGEARLREEVLAEKGQDWKQIDEQFDSLKIKGNLGSGDSRPGSGDRSGSTRRGFWRGNAGEERNERSWRKPESVEGSRPTSAVGNNPTEKIEENGNTF